jgi:hypothetical protein
MRLNCAGVKDAGVEMHERNSMLKRIGLEEHFMVHGFLEYLAENIQNIGPELAERVVKPLSEFGEGRLQIMDGNGSSFQASELHNLQVASSRHISYPGRFQGFQCRRSWQFESASDGYALEEFQDQQNTYRTAQNNDVRFCASLKGSVQM